MLEFSGCCHRVLLNWIELFWPPAFQETPSYRGEQKTGISSYGLNLLSKAEHNHCLKTLLQTSSPVLTEFHQNNILTYMHITHITEKNSKLRLLGKWQIIFDCIISVCTCSKIQEKSYWGKKKSDVMLSYHSMFSFSCNDCMICHHSYLIFTSLFGFISIFWICMVYRNSSPIYL